MLDNRGRVAGFHLGGLPAQSVTDTKPMTGIKPVLWDNSEDNVHILYGYDEDKLVHVPSCHEQSTDDEAMSVWGPRSRWPSRRSSE